MRPIAMLGNFRPSWSSENYVSRSFVDLGREVVHFQEDELSSDDIIEGCARFDPEFLLYFRTWGLKDGPTAAFKVWEALRRKGIVTVTMSLDLYWGLNREPMIHDDPMFRTDIVFTADGGRQEDFKRAGINHVWLPPAVYARDCWRGGHRKEYECDVAFVGSYQAYHREWPFRRCLVDRLREEYGPRFRHWGDRNNVRGWDLNDLYASAKVVVGDSLARPYYWSDRVTETIGRGGFLVSPKVEGMEAEGFINGKTIVYYEAGNMTSMLDAVRLCLSEDCPRAEISERGFQLVKSRHTYEHRCRRVLDEIAKISPGRQCEVSAE